MITHGPRCVLGRPYRGAPDAMSQPPPGLIVSVWQCAPAMSQAVSRVMPRAVSRRVVPCRSACPTVSKACSAVSWPCLAVSQGHVVACIVTHPAARQPSCNDTPIRITTQSPTVRPPSCHDTIDCIATHPHQLGCVRARCRTPLRPRYRTPLRAAGLVVAHPGGVVARCRPCHGPPSARPASWCHDIKIVS